MAMILGGDAGRRGGAEIGQHDRQQSAVDHTADQIAEKDPAPIGQNGFAVGVILDPRQRYQNEAAGDEIETKEHDEDQSDGKDQRADQGLTGLDRTGDGKTGRCRKDAARKPTADDEIEWG